MELVRYLLKQPDVKPFLSQRICQDPLENFGHQWQEVGFITTQMFKSLQRTPKLFVSSTRSVIGPKGVTATEVEVNAQALRKCG